MFSHKYSFVSNGLDILSIWTIRTKPLHLVKDVNYARIASIHWGQSCLCLYSWIVCKSWSFTTPITTININTSLMIIYLRFHTFVFVKFIDIFLCPDTPRAYVSSSSSTFSRGLSGCLVSSRTRCLLKYYPKYS